MTFAEHLEELRARIIRSLIALVVAAIGCLAFQDTLFEWAQRPYERARHSIRDRFPAHPDSIHGRLGSHSRILARLEADRRAQTAVLLALVERAELPATPELEAAKAALRDSFEHPIEVPVIDEGADIGPLKAIGTTEQFLSYVKVALLFASFLAAPYMLFQMWQFIGAGLYDHERKVVMQVFPFSVGMFLAGMAFGYTVLVPVGLEFLLSYGDPGLLEPSITSNSYLSLLFVMLFVMGFVFQIPLVMTVTSRMGLIEPETFRKKRKPFILGAFIAAAIMTPPDYTTQLLVGFPMLVLYEIGILLSVYSAKRRRQAAESSSGSS